MREVISQFTDDEFEHLMKNYPNEYKELVRCKDCKHYNKRWKICCVDIASLHHLQHPADYYCASAERRDKQ